MSCFALDSPSIVRTWLGAWSAATVPPAWLFVLAKTNAGVGGDDGGDGFRGTGGPHIRARLSPSLATGLIGLKENVFIGEFFRTMGFLPFTTERCVEMVCHVCQLF